MNRGAKWIAGAWVAFAAENVLLSEHRTWIIDEVGERAYHRLFSTLSTATMLGMAWSYARHGRGPLMAPLPASVRAVGAAAALVGALLLSHAQLPLVPAPKQAPGTGVDRITRHPLLYGAGLVCAGIALRAHHASTRVLCAGPLCVAVVGTHHQDSRYRRGMGGTLTPARDAATSNIPFAALMSGRQSWGPLLEELHWQRVGVALASVALLLSARGSIPTAMRT